MSSFTENSNPQLKASTQAHSMLKPSVTSKMGFRPVTSRRKRSWKHLLLGVLLLANLLYVWMAIARYPDTIRSSFNAIAAQRKSSFTLSGDESTTSMTSQSKTSKPTASAFELPSNTSSARRLKCLGWRATKDCNPDGARIPEKDQDCGGKIPFGSSGYCEIEDEDTHEKLRVMKRTCSKGKSGAIFQCSDSPGFANFHVEAQNAVAKAFAGDITLQNENNDQNITKGIAIVVYPKLMASAYATIRVLRDVLGCGLPIEIWYRPDEMRDSSAELDTLKSLAGNDSTGDITLEQIDHPRARRFNAKIYAIHHSKFDQVLFLDADNAPVRDPSYLFKAPEFVRTGAIFWPDYWHPDHTIFFINKKSLVWELLDTPFVDMFEQESGQLLVDRRRHAAALELVTFYGFHQPNYFDRLKLAWGDKDLFRFAWLKLNAPFHMIQPPPATAGRMYGDSFCGMTMVQHDMNGEVLFLHRNQLKLTGKPSTNQAGNLAGQPQADSFPDPVMWTHLLSFRSTSPRSEYVVQGHPNPQFSKQRRCFGRSKVESNLHFYFREFADLSFAKLETNLRYFAMDGVMQMDNKKTNKN